MGYIICTQERLHEVPCRLNRKDSHHCDRISRLPGRRIDDFHSRVSEIGSHNSTAPVMSVQSDFGYKNSLRDIFHVDLQYLVIKIAKQLFVYQISYIMSTVILQMTGLFSMQ